jgi:NitT/TauT family transport system substrate-binding protein
MNHKNSVAISLRTTLAAVLSYIGIAGTGSIAAAAPPEPISFNYGLVTADQYALYVAQDLGLFEKHGLKPKFTPFQNGALLLSALKSESIDVTSIGMAAVFAIGQDTKLKLIFWDVNSSPAVGFVTKQADVQSFRDVAKAGKIGIAIGSCAQVSLYYLTKAAGVPYEKLDVINIPPAQARNALHGGAIQSAMVWAPYSFLATEDGARIVNYTTDWPPEGGFCPSFTAVRANYLSANPEVGKRLVAVQADALKAIESDPSIAIKALQNRLSLSEGIARRMFERVWASRPTYAQQLDPNSPYSLSAPTGLAAILNRGAEAFNALKIVQKPIDPKLIEAAVDPTFIKAQAGASR